MTSRQTRCITSIFFGIILLTFPTPVRFDPQAQRVTPHRITTAPRNGLVQQTLSESVPFVSVTDEMLLNPSPDDWLMVHRTYDFQSFSPLDQINQDNVGRLQLAWMRAMDEGPQQIRPLVYNGVMYIAHPNSDHIQALDATSGDLIWDYERAWPDDLREFVQFGGRTRNLAIYGNYIFH